MEEVKTLLDKPKENLIQFGTTYYFSATSIDDHFKDPKTQKKLTLIKSFDTIVSVFVITPLCVANWQSVWFLYDIHGDLFPIYETFAFANCILIGWTFLREIIQDTFRKYKQKYQNWLLCRLIKSVYILNYNMMLVLQWRGAFTIFDMISCVKLNQSGVATSASIRTTLLITVTSAGWLLFLQSLRNALAVPFIIALDKSNKIFFYPTRFRTDVSALYFNELITYELLVLNCFEAVLVNHCHVNDLNIHGWLLMA